MPPDLSRGSSVIVPAEDHSSLCLRDRARWPPIRQRALCLQESTARSRSLHPIIGNLGRGSPVSYSNHEMLG